MPQMTPQSVRVRESQIRRESVVNPILEEKGWSLLEFAQEANLDSQTVNDCLKGKTTPYRSTRKKLADALGLRVEDLPR
jgi:lambda repressor-like predicted transcriptional regulator